MKHYLHMTTQYHVPRISMASIKGEILVMITNKAGSVILAGSVCCHSHYTCMS